MPDNHWSRTALVAVLGGLLAATACSSAQTPAAQQTQPNAAVKATSAESRMAAESGPALGIATENFDESIRPQDDFFEYVNGTWLEKTEIPEDRSSYGSFAELREQADEDLRAIIEDAAGETHPEGSDLQKVGTLYRSFMDTARIEALGAKPIAGDLARIEAVSSHTELPALFAEATRYGVERPFSFWISQDAKNSDAYISYVGQSGLGLPDRDYYFEDGEKFATIREAYVDYIKTMLGLVGHEDPNGAAQRIMELETAIAEHHWKRARTRDRNATYNKYTVAELDELTPSFDWTAYLEAAGAGEADEVIVRQPDYFQALDEVLSETPVETWKDYMAFKTVSSAARYLSSDFVDASFAFHGRVLSGLEQNRPRWKRGVGTVEGSLGDVLGRLYVERHFSPEAKARMEELVDNLIEAFRLGIDDLEWMSEETKAQARAKLAKFTPKIGYPNEWEDYSALEIREGDLVGNVRRAGEFHYQDMIDRLGEPVDRDEWFMQPFTVNAYYSPSMNQIVFPAAILQPPFFNPEADDAVNYGAIGGVIGHEISHGFDDQGRKSDGDGNLRDWWTEEDAAAFDARADRLAEQYSAYNPIGDLHIDGRLTLGENIGDLSGLAVAYDAYRLSLDGEKAPVIGGFTGDQRFFLGWAQAWRYKYRDEALRQQLMTDPHSPARYRVNGVLRNMDEFYEAFDVSRDDAMYLPPEKRVEIW